MEESILVPAAVLGVINLLRASLTTSETSGERFYFHMIFALWLAFVYEIIECLFIPDLLKKFMYSSSLGSVFSVVSVSISLALLTIQTLVAAAAVRENLWLGTSWTDAYIPIVATFHASVNHNSTQFMVFAVIILHMSLCIFLLLIIRNTGVLPSTIQVGLLSIDEFFDIMSISFKIICSSFAIATAYIGNTTVWALPVALALPIFLNTFIFLFNFDFTKVRKVSRSRYTAPAGPSDYVIDLNEDSNEPPSAPPQSAFKSVETKDDIFDVNEGRIPLKKQPKQHLVFLEKRDAHQRHSDQAVNKTPYKYHSGPLFFQNVASKIAQDALLFKNTRPLVHKNKKCS
jgi:hypothetical protein